MSQKDEWSCPECDGSGIEECSCCGSELGECDACMSTGVDEDKVDVRAYRKACLALHKFAKVGEGLSWDLFDDQGKWIGRQNKQSKVCVADFLKVSKAAK